MQPWLYTSITCHTFLFHCIFAGEYSRARVSSLLGIRRLIVSNQLWIRVLFTVLFNPVSNAIPFVDTEAKRAFSDSCAQLWERFSPITCLRGRTFDFWGGGGGRGVFEWFGLGKFFFRDIWWCKIFFQHYTSGGIIFLCEGCLFPRYFLPTYYFPSKSVSRIFFSSNHPSINPCLHPLPPPDSKVKWS